MLLKIEIRPSRDYAMSMERWVQSILIIIVCVIQVLNSEYQCYDLFVSLKTQNINIEIKWYENCIFKYKLTVSSGWSSMSKKHKLTNKLYSDSKLVPQ